MQTKSETITEPSASETVVFTPTDPEAGPPFEIDVYTPAYTRRFEVMTPNSGGGRKAWKSFEHYKSAQAPMPTRGVELHVEGPGGYYPPYYSRGQARNPLVGYYCQTWGSSWIPYGDAGDSNLPAFYEPRADGGFVNPPQDLDGLQRRAVKSMLPIIRAELSLPNSILELKDFKWLVPRLKTVYSRIKSGNITVAGTDLSAPLALIAKLGWIRMKNLTLRQVARKVASTHLEYSFAWAPLISDIMAIKRVISRTTGRINDLINRAGRTQTRHFRWVWQEYPDSFDDRGFEAGWDWHDASRSMQDVGSERRVTYDPTVFHPQVEYNYNYSALQTANAQFLAHLDALGVNLNPAIIWNAIPFSFVVDWVLKIGPMLDGLKVENMRPEINIHRMLWSVKRKRRITITKKIRSRASGLAYQTSNLGTVWQEAYRRSLSGFDLSSYVEASGLSLREISLGASLVVARMKRRR